MTLINNEEALQKLEGVEGLQELVQALRACRGLKIQKMGEKGHEEILEEIKGHLESSKRHVKLFDDLAKDLKKRVGKGEQRLIDFGDQFKTEIDILLWEIGQLEKKLVEDPRLQHRFLYVSAPDDGMLGNFIQKLETQIKKLSSAIQFQKDIQEETPPKRGFLGFLGT